MSAQCNRYLAKDLFVPYLLTAPNAESACINACTLDVRLNANATAMYVQRAMLLIHIAFVCQRLIHVS